MAISLTLFKSIYDNKTHRNMSFTNWEQFVEFLQMLSKRKLKGKRDAQLISPTVYLSNTTRSNKNVLAWAGWAAVDVDDYVFEGDLENRLRSRFGDWSYVIYSTASSTVDHPKFRIVFQLGKHVPSAQIKHFWWALNSELNSIGDKQTKDLSRMYYIPAQYAEAYNFFYVNSGKPIDVDSLLLKHPYEEKQNSRSFIDRLPEDLQKQVIQHRQSKLNAVYHWSSYEDCPFVNKQLITEYRSIANIDNSGRYAMIYKIMSSIAINAIKRQYPITSYEIAELVRQLDRDTSNRYQNRPLEIEADRALEYAYKNA
jgi:hypothetical protein